MAANDKKYKCDCGASFARSDNLTRHKNTACKLRLVNNQGGIINNGNNNNAIINNGVINNNIVQININVNLVPLDKESINDLTVQEWGKVLTSKRNVLIELIEMINCKKPLHHNIYYPDNQRKNCVAYIGDKFRTSNIYDVLGMLIEQRIMDIREVLDTWGKGLDKNFVKLTKTILDGIEKNNKEKKIIMRLMKSPLNDCSENVYKTSGKYIELIKKDHIKLQYNNDSDDEIMQVIFNDEDFDSD